MDLDYNIVGMNLSGIRRSIVNRFLDAMDDNRRPEAVYVEGPPGEGKTFTVYDAALDVQKALGVDECRVYCNATSCLEPTDVAGVPWAIQIEGITRYTSFIPPKWAWEISQEFEDYMKKGDPNYTAPPVILMFDDLPAAHFQTQTAFFKGVHEGKWGDFTARKNVMVVATGNRVEDMSGANAMPCALASRFVLLRAKCETDDWLEWAQDKGNIHPYLIAYFRRNKGNLNEFNADVANRADKAFACPRSIESLSNLFKSKRINREDELFEKNLYGTIGMSIGSDLIAFLNNTTAVVPPDVIVKNPKKAKIPGKKSLDSLYATIASLEAHIRVHPRDWKAAVVYATRKEMASDVGIMLANSIMKTVHQYLKPEERDEACSSDLLTELYERYESILSSAADYLEEDNENNG